MMESLDQLLKKSVEQTGLPGIHAVGELAKDWADIVGEEVAKKTTPLALKDKVLIIRTANPGWSHQLTMLKPTIITKLHDRNFEIEDLRFVLREEAE